MIKLIERVSILTVEGEVEPLPDREPTLKDLQGWVGGYIQTVYKTNLDDMLMVVDEEGLLKGKAHNKVASQLTGLRIVGDVVILPMSYFN